MRGQLSFFTAGELPPGVDDLEGLLAGRGHLVRRGDAARLSIVVDAPWRAATLLAAFADRGLAGERALTLDDRDVVRTGFEARLLSLAGRWTRGARIVAPAGWRLDGPRVRLWTLAAGRPDDYGYLLPLADEEERTWAVVGSALHDAGIPATLVGPRAGGPAYRITGRRIGRLGELVGTPPDGVPTGAWPMS